VRPPLVGSGREDHWVRESIFFFCSPRMGDHSPALDSFRSAYALARYTRYTRWLVPPSDLGGRWSTQVCACVYDRWGDNERGVSFTFGADVVQKFLHKHDLDLVCRAHQVVEDGYEFFAKRQLVTLFSAPNYCGEFDNAGAMMSVDDTLMCSFQVPRLSLFLFYSAPPPIFCIGPCGIL
jgi:hypothetical protein